MAGDGVSFPHARKAKINERLSHHFSAAFVVLSQQNQFRTVGVCGARRLWSGRLRLLNRSVERRQALCLATTAAGFVLQ
jgi:hypothetical protein